MMNNWGQGENAGMEWPNATNRSSAPNCVAGGMESASAYQMNGERTLTSAASNGLRDRLPKKSMVVTSAARAGVN